MDYDIITDVLKLVAQFEAQNQGRYPKDIQGFKRWIADSNDTGVEEVEPDWVGKENGRSAESVINTLVVHLNRYAKSYSKSVIYDSDFATQEDFIYLINLKAFGAMGKMDLIKKNVHEKSVGMKIIDRLIKQGWVDQSDSKTDKRSKVVEITDAGLRALKGISGKLKQASKIVTGDLTPSEKMELIRLLQKLDAFHNPIYLENIEPSDLLESVANGMDKTKK